MSLSHLFLTVFIVITFVHGQTPENMPDLDEYQLPRYHFNPGLQFDEWWINDPIGTFKYKGKWHLFYQLNPYGSTWGNISWGHAVSDDLVHWKHLPIAISPTEHYETDGCWSGSAFIDDDGIPGLWYTAARPEVQCLARPKDPSDPELREWIKDENNPIMTQQPEHATGWRDPVVKKMADGRWQMVLGGGTNANNQYVGAVFVYYSSSPTGPFEYSGNMLDSTEIQSGPVFQVWECPIPVREADNKGFILISAENVEDPKHEIVISGEFREDNTFEGTVSQAIDTGVVYASRNFIDTNIFIGWLRESLTSKALLHRSWAGSMTLPRDYTLVSGFLQVKPNDAYKLLRKENTVEEYNLTVSPQIIGTAFQHEVVLRFNETEGVQLWQFTVLASETTKKGVDIFVKNDNGMMILSTDNAETDVDPMECVKGAFKPTTSIWIGGEEHVVRIFVDRSVVEVYHNDRSVLSARAYLDEHHTRILGFVHSDNKDILTHCTITTYLMEDVNLNKE
ncbi:hypothetical protein PCE1_004511 [Barthelona sp. PCE]